MTHNLDELAKLAPFHFVEEQNCGWFAGEDATIIDEPDIAAALNEWAELRAYRERTEPLVKAAGELWACLQSSKDCGEIFVPKRLAVFMQRFAAALDAGDPAPKEATDGE